MVTAMAEKESPQRNSPYLTLSPSPRRVTPVNSWAPTSSISSMEENAMNRCRSPQTIRHGRGSSADSSLIATDPYLTWAGGCDTTAFEDDHSDGSSSFTGFLNSVISAETFGENDVERRKALVQQVLAKINRTKDLIRGEQTARDDNVNEYLRLASNADKLQLSRIKALFEKKNQKYSRKISHLQTKLDTYNKRLHELESLSAGASLQRHPRELLRDVGHGLRNVGGNIKDGITGISGSVMAKPKEFAHLIRNRFGSADNINITKRSADGSFKDNRIHHGSSTLPSGMSLTSTGLSAKNTRAGVATTAQGGPSDEGSECSSASVTSESFSGVRKTSTNNSQSEPPKAMVSTTLLDPVVMELRMRKAEIDRLRSKFDSFKKSVSKEVETLTQSIHEEKFRNDRLEEQINDLTELHQKEIESIKNCLADMEEKFHYQSDEKLNDLRELVENCQTKISKMEHQQAQQQQYLNLEGLSDSNARAVVVKTVNIVLTLLQFALLLLATAVGILMPFFKTRVRSTATGILLVAGFIGMKIWPVIRDYYHLWPHSVR